ncbi:MAG: TldD/PmbA family protein [Burkholderiaceae bacterium]
MPMPSMPSLSAEQAQIIETAHRLAPPGHYWSLRFVAESTESISARQNIVSAPSRRHDSGAMVTVGQSGAMAYAATADVSAAGLQDAFDRAQRLAASLAGRFDPGATQYPLAPPQSHYESAVAQAVPESLAERIDVVEKACRSLAVSDAIVDWGASLTITRSQQLFVTAEGGPVVQHFDFVVPNLRAVARTDGLTQTRTLAGQYNGYCLQGGWEVLEKSGFLDQGPRIAHEAIELTQAPNCPTGKMDVVLMPDQMMLQIHESIGHPLELDRILGDERNFAGTSFVSLDMFGDYQYGSEHLNVSYAPDVPGQFASFAFDDEGTAAERTLLIERGRLVRPLGGAVSAARAQAHGFSFEPVATTRACSWNRAPIDRMSNLNVEPGDQSFQDIIAATSLGVLMRTNCSWSIDDSRNKFQFGCEYGQMIRDGQLAEVVRNPNYRGVSSSFWRSLKMVGDESTFDVMGTPYCGKGEPMQVIRVGHASPACRFENVEVFGGGA